MAVLRSDLRDSLGGSEVFQEAPSLFWNRVSPKLTPVVANWILSCFVNHQLGMVEWQELGSYQQPAGGLILSNFTPPHSSVPLSLRHIICFSLSTVYPPVSQTPLSTSILCTHMGTIHIIAHAKGP